MENTSPMSDKRDSLVSDLKSVIQDAENLLRNSSQQAGAQFDERYKNARARFEETLGQAKVGLCDMEQKVSAHAREAADTTDQFVKAHPWQSVGIGAAVGLIAGFLMMRR